MEDEEYTNSDLAKDLAKDTVTTLAAAAAGYALVFAAGFAYYKWTERRDRKNQKQD